MKGKEWKSRKERKDGRIGDGDGKEMAGGGEQLRDTVIG